MHIGTAPLPPCCRSCIPPTHQGRPGQQHVLGLDPKIDDLLHQAAASNDIEQQKKLYGEVEQIVAENAYHLGLYPQTTRLVTKKRLKDVWIEPSEGEPVLHDAWLARRGAR